MYIALKISLKKFGTELDDYLTDNGGYVITKIGLEQTSAVTQTWQIARLSLIKLSKFFKQPGTTTSSLQHVFNLVQCLVAIHCEHPHFGHHHHIFLLPG